MVQIPEFSGEASFKDILEPAMEIARSYDKMRAAIYLNEYRKFLREVHPDLSNDRINEIISINLGYWAGYHDMKTREAVKITFGALHPFFGSRQPTAEEAFRAGQEWAKRGLAFEFIRQKEMFE